MKLFLAKSVPFALCGYQDEVRFVNVKYNRMSGYHEGNAEEEAFCSEFQQFMHTNYGDRPDNIFNFTSLGFGSSGDGSGLAINRSRMTNALLDCFIGREVTLQLEIIQIRDEHTGRDFMIVKSKVMKLRKNLFTCACEDKEFPEDCPELKQALRSGWLLHGTLNLVVDVQGPPIVFQAPEEPVEDKWQVVKKILQEEVASDVVIIPGQGNPVKAHKAFLVAHSQILQKEVDLEEGGQGITVKMKEMTEEGVRALLAYLYYWDDGEASDNCNLAFQLLSAGYRYDIQVLKTGMERLMLGKEDKWFNDVEVVKKLYEFAKKLKGSQLKQKEIKVLKANVSSVDFAWSHIHHELARKYPEIAEELKE